MLDFKVYNRRDLQHFMQMLNQCEIEGVIDIRFVRAALHKHLFIAQKIRPVTNRKHLPPERFCPYCKNPMGNPIVVDGLRVVGCKKCRYSEVV